MDVYSLSGIVSTVFSIATFFLPDRWKSKRITLALFVLAIVLLAMIITHLNSRLLRIEKISRAANELSKDKETGYTNEGYIQASLAFMEQNKDIYPDSYIRATNIYNNYKKRTGSFSSDVVELSFEMDGLIKGIAVLNSTE